MFFPITFRQKQSSPTTCRTIVLVQVGRVAYVAYGPEKGKILLHYEHHRSNPCARQRSVFARKSSSVEHQIATFNQILAENLARRTFENSESSLGETRHQPKMARIALVEEITSQTSSVEDDGLRPIQTSTRQTSLQSYSEWWIQSLEEEEQRRTCGKDQENQTSQIRAQIETYRKQIPNLCRVSHCRQEEINRTSQNR